MLFMRPLLIKRPVNNCVVMPQRPSWQSSESKEVEAVLLKKGGRVSASSKLRETHEHGSPTILMMLVSVWVTVESLLYNIL